MYRSILLPLDGSPFSEAAIPYAITLARGRAERIHVLHVVPSAMSEWYPDREAYARWESQTRPQKQSYLDAVADRLERTTGVRTTTELVEGMVLPTLEQVADQVDADVVVMTTHGRSGLQRMWLGSVADRFVRAAERPVLLIRPAAEPGAEPEREEPPRLRRVLVPLDGSALSEQILPAAQELADQTEPSLILLTVVPSAAVAGEAAATPFTTRVLDEELALRDRQKAEAEAYLADIADRIPADRFEVTTRVVVAPDPAGAILEQADELEADAIAVATRGRGGVQRLLVGSVADKVIRGSTRPVLVFRPVSEGPNP